MTKKQSIPRRLFKYRAFNNLTLDMIIAENLYYADPSTFNDPLDTRPSLNNDLPASDLERAIRQPVEQRVNADMKAAKDHQIQGSENPRSYCSAQSSAGRSGHF